MKLYFKIPILALLLYGCPNYESKRILPDMVASIYIYEIPEISKPFDVYIEVSDVLPPTKDEFDVIEKVNQRTITALSIERKVNATSWAQVYFDEIPTPPIGDCPGEVHTVKLSGLTIKLTEPGEYRLTVIADFSNEVEERDERNNSTTKIL